MSKLQLDGVAELSYKFSATGLLGKKWISTNRSRRTALAILEVGITTLGKYVAVAAS